MSTAAGERAPLRAVAAHPLIAAVDLGKTSCRLRVVAASDRHEPLYEGSGPGAPGLAEADGAESAADAVARVVAGYRSDGLAFDHLVVGAAGTEAAPDAARELATLLRRATGADATVASDAVIAHAGALAGRQGTVLIAGTGSIALGLRADGEFAQADGWGPWVGDEGSGRWIGQEGLRAAIRDADGRGPATALATAMRDIVGRPHDVPGWVSRGQAPARTLATFAQIVLDHARDDAVAASIVERALDLLAETVRAVTPPGSPVALVGGLLGHAGFRAALEERLRVRGAELVPSAGTPLDGACLLASEAGSPYDRKVFRAR